MYGVLYCTQSVTLCDLIFSFELPIDTYILIITRVLIERNGDSRKEKNAIRFRLSSLFQQSCSCYCDFVRIKRKTKKYITLPEQLFLIEKILERGKIDIADTQIHKMHKKE